MKRAFFSEVDDARVPERREVPAEVGLIELQDVFKVADAQGPLMEQVEDAESVRVCQGLQHFRNVHAHTVI